MAAGRKESAWSTGHHCQPRPPQNRNLNQQPSTKPRLAFVVDAREGSSSRSRRRTCLPWWLQGAQPRGGQLPGCPPSPSPGEAGQGRAGVGTQTSSTFPPPGRILTTLCSGRAHTGLARDGDGRAKASAKQEARQKPLLLPPRAVLSHLKAKSPLLAGSGGAMPAPSLAGFHSRPRRHLSWSSAASALPRCHYATEVWPESQILSLVNELAWRPGAAWREGRWPEPASAVGGVGAYQSRGMKNTVAANTI